MIRKLLLSIAIISVIFFITPLIHAQANDSSKTNLWNAVTSGKLIKHFRSYYINRHFSEPKAQESIAFGGWLGYETAPFYGINAAAIGYTSQGLGLNDKDKSGAMILGPEQKGITVLGQAYLKFETEKNTIKLFRQLLTTPFINPHDNRMIPQTFEAYTLESKFIKNLDIFLSYVAKIKGRINSNFISMSEFAGIDNTNEGVTFAGLIFTPKDSLKIQAWNYYCYEFMNVVCSQIDYNWKFSNKLSLCLSAQGFYQEDIGKSLYGQFHTGFGGMQTVLDWCGLKPKLGFSVTDKSHDIVNPWSGWFGYTSILEEDSDLAGEKAWIAGIAYDFGNISIKGLGISIEHTESYMPPGGWFSKTDQKETDITVDYAFSGKLNGLALRLQAAFVDNSLSTNLESYNDYRVILNYDF